MIPAQEMLSGLYGAWRLARADAGGMAYFNATVEGFWRSFTAALLIAPLYAVLLAIRYQVQGLGIDPARYVALEGIGYVIAWFAFPLIMFYVVQLIGRERQFFGFIIAYNWASVLQNLVFLPLAVLGELKYLPAETMSTLGLVVLVLVYVYTWFIARTALAISGLAAAGVVVGDFMLSVVLNMVTEGLLRAS